MRASCALAPCHSKVPLRRPQSPLAPFPPLSSFIHPSFPPPLPSSLSPSSLSPSSISSSLELNPTDLQTIKIARADRPFRTGGSFQWTEIDYKRPLQAPFLSPPPAHIAHLSFFLACRYIRFLRSDACSGLVSSLRYVRRYAVEYNEIVRSSLKVHWNCPRIIGCFASVQNCTCYCNVFSFHQLEMRSLLLYYL